MARNKNIQFDEEEYGDDYIDEEFDEETGVLISLHDKKC